jgi:hypothetical protein
MVEELEVTPTLRRPWPVTTESLPVEEVAVSETVPVGTTHPVPEHLTVAVNVIGVPCTTGRICPAPSFTVVVEPRAAEAAPQLFTRAFASNEPKPVARS